MGLTCNLKRTTNVRANLGDVCEIISVVVVTDRVRWLHITDRTSFKLAVMMCRSIHGTSPSYVESCFTRVADMTFIRLRSNRLEVPLVRLSTVGRRAFPVSGATAWNDLPLHVASAPSLAVFRQ